VAREMLAGVVDDPSVLSGARPRAAASHASTGSARAAAVAVSLVASLFGPGTAQSAGLPGQSARGKSVSRPAPPCKGSSNPTLFSSNRRLELTAGGRLLAIYDPHGDGQRLVWRARGRWRTTTRGSVRNGFFHEKGGSDRPASIAVARDPRGKEHAWIVWAGDSFQKGRLALSLRRLSDLDDRRGPKVGPPVTLVRPGSGHVRPDIAIERSPGGPRAAIVWLDRTGVASFDLTVGWITSLGRDRPRLVARKVLLTTRRGTPTATLVPSGGGMRVVATTGKGRLRVFSHRKRAPLTRWRSAGGGVKVARDARPTAVLFKRKSILAAAAGRRRNVVMVVRFKRNGTRSRIVGRIRGHAQPSLARVGRRAVVVMIRRRDGSVVSRSFGGGKRVARRDRVEIGRRRGGRFAWPNALRRSPKRLHFIVQGPRCRYSSVKHSVLAVSHRL
jgi:hypothetical protein